MRQSLALMPKTGPVLIDDPRVVFPPKEEVYTTIEGTIEHFKLVMEGLKLPAGEVSSYNEAGNGELGFYLVSDGSGTPYRLRIRPPCFYTTAGDGRVMREHSDVVCLGEARRVPRVAATWLDSMRRGRTHQRSRRQ